MQDNARTWLEFVLARGVVGALSWLPTVAVECAADGLAAATHALAGRRRRAARERVVGRLGVDSVASHRIVRRVFASLARNAVEALVLAERLDVDREVALEGAEHLERARSWPGGVVVVSGHLGAWELLPAVVGRWLAPPWVVVRPPSNPRLARWLDERRAPRCAGTVPKIGGLAALAERVEAGACALLLLDQNAGARGVRIPFLGAPASHFATADRLAGQHGALILPAYLLRVEPRPRSGPAYRFVVEAPLASDRPGEHDADAPLTRALSRSLERRVRADPGQWLWLHDRWRPPREGAGVAVRASDGGPGRA